MRRVTYLVRMTGVRQASADETRRRLLATARRLFAQQGYFSTGTTEIVREAGVGTRGALYHHFPTKEALFAAVLEEVEVDLTARVGAGLEGATWRERLGHALDGFLDASLEPEVRRILLIDGPAVLGWEAWRAVEARYGIGAIRHMLEEGGRDGSLAVADAESMAHLLLSAIDEAALFIAHAKDAGQARAAAGASLAALLSGLESDSSQ
jgi:AcrR family transcriptional regulator